MEKKGKVEGERERERVRGSVVQKYAVMGWWWVLFAYEFSPSVFVWKLFLFLLWEPAWKLTSSGPNSHSTFKSVLSSLSLAFSLQYASIFYVSFFSVLMSSSERVMGKWAGHPLMNTHSALSQQQSSLHHCAYLCVCVCRHGSLLLLPLRHSTAIHELSKRLSNLSAPIIPSPKQKASSSERKQSLDQRAHPLLQNTVKLIMQSDCQSCWPLLAF